MLRYQRPPFAKCCRDNKYTFVLLILFIYFMVQQYERVKGKEYLHQQLGSLAVGRRGEW
jgi:hypothetical protein